MMLFWALLACTPKKNELVQSRTNVIAPEKPTIFNIQDDIETLDLTKEKNIVLKDDINIFSVDITTSGFLSIVTEGESQSAMLESTMQHNVVRSTELGSDQFYAIQATVEPGKYIYAIKGESGVYKIRPQFKEIADITPQIDNSSVHAPHDAVWLGETNHQFELSSGVSIRWFYFVSPQEGKLEVQSSCLDREEDASLTVIENDKLGKKENYYSLWSSYSDAPDLIIVDEDNDDNSCKETLSFEVTANTYYLVGMHIKNTDYDEKPIFVDISSKFTPFANIEE